MVDQLATVKLRKEDFDQQTRLNYQPEYFECSICMEIPTGSDILECPVCAARGCKDCLKDFTTKKVKGALQPDMYTCVICLKEYKMKEPNKIMMQVLTKVLKFDCTSCQRYWSYEDFQTHKLKGNCKKDPNAVNNVSILKIEQEQHTSLQQSASKPVIAPQIVAPKVQIISPSAGIKLTSLYICERDSKQVFEFNVNTNQVNKCQVNMEMNFQHNFQYCQTPS